jgi:hypothetical protein
MVTGAVLAFGCDDGESGSTGDEGVAGAGGEGGQGGVGGEGGQGGVGGEGGQGAEGGQGGQGAEGGGGGGGVELKSFGEECRVPAGCDSDSARWPDCIGDECSSGDCSIPGLSGEVGFCGRECTADFACEGAASGPFGDEFRCLTDGVAGTCAPGSNQRCDGAGNGACRNAEEVCVFQLVFAADETYGATCQPPAPGGLPNGARCDGEGDYCANGNCLYGACRQFCDPAAPTNLCDAESEQCFDGLPLNSDGSLAIDLCVPKNCGSDSDCSDGMVCQVALDFRGEPYIVGFCAFPDDGPEVVGAGERCDDTASVCDVICLGEGANSYCAHMCEDDSDCVNGTCSVITFGVGDNGESAPAKLCVAATGSGRTCARDADCAPDGATPQEACEYVIRGNVVNGRPQGENYVEGRCSAIPAGAVEVGEVCGADAPCQSEGLCLTSGRTTFCSATCAASADCPAGFVCGGLRLTETLVAGACIADGGSLAVCEDDAACPGEGEYCAYNVLPGAEGPSLETICRAGRDGGAFAGQPCAQNNACRSLICEARSTSLADPGYCLGACTTDEQCSEDGSITCEQIRLSLGADAVVSEDDIFGGFCVPGGLCDTCNFAGTGPCGGDFVCSRVRFPGNGADSSFGGACLPPCAGLDAECPAGHTCQPALGEDGAAIAGSFACTPDAPNETCTRARPR